jgi:hypothetical protein
MSVSSITIAEGGSLDITYPCNARFDDDTCITHGDVSVEGVPLIDVTRAAWRPIEDGWTGDWTTPRGHKVTDTVNGEGFHRHYHHGGNTYITPTNDSFGEIFAAIVVSYLERKG